MIRKVIIAFTVLVFSVQANATSTNFSDYEKHLMYMAYYMAVGEGLGKTAMGVLVVETTMGRTGPIGDKSNGFGKRSYGVMQVKLATTKDVIDRRPDLDPGFDNDYELIVELINNEKWNMQIAIEQLRWYYHERDLNWRETLVAYNRGLNGSRNYDPNVHPYAQRVAYEITEGIAAEFYEKHIKSWR